MRSLKWILLGIYLILAGLALLGVNIGGNVMDLSREFAPLSQVSCS